MNKIFKFRITGVLIHFGIIAVFGGAAMLLWNALLPGIFGLPSLNYWQAVGLLMLVRIFFGGAVFGGGNFMPRDGRFLRRGGQGIDEMLFQHGNALREKWMNMSKEERKAFIEKEREFMRFHRGFSHLREFFEEAGGKNPAEDEEDKK